MMPDTDEKMTESSIEESKVRLDQVRDKLSAVIDPCSRFNGMHMPLDDLGMIEGVEETSPGEVRVDLFLDDPMCIYMVDIHRQVRAAVGSVDGVNKVEVKVIGDRLWTPEQMKDRAREKIAHWKQIRTERGFRTLGGKVPVEIGRQPQG